MAAEEGPTAVILLLDCAARCRSQRFAVLRIEAPALGVTAAVEGISMLLGNAQRSRI